MRENIGELILESLLAFFSKQPIHIMKQILYVNAVGKSREYPGKTLNAAHIFSQEFPRRRGKD
jgi:hypothetical protein